jgi:uncharacterized protein
MKVQIDQIRPEGLTIEAKLDPKELALDTEIAAVQGPLALTARLQRVNDVVQARMSIMGLIKLVCCRCLEDYTVAVDTDFDVDYPLEKGIRTIDLDPDIRDYILLDYPIKPLCKEDCKGLCPKCGQNLNSVTKCDCDQ